MNNIDSFDRIFSGSVSSLITFSETSEYIFSKTTVKQYVLSVQNVQKFLEIESKNEISPLKNQVCYHFFD